jgi:hypothetical protein
VPTDIKQGWRNRFPPAPPAIQSGRFNAPTGGINAVAPLGGMPSSDCVMMENIIPMAYGLRVRQGYRKWRTVPQGIDGIRTVIPYTGSKRDGTQDKLYVATNVGIYDCTDRTATAPTLVATWPVQTGRAGACSFCEFTTVATGHIMLLCDEENGYWTYNETTDVWAAVPASDITMTGGGTPPDPKTLVMVLVYQNRVWFVQRNSSVAYFCDVVGAYKGNVTAFEFGNKFRVGGDILTMGNWSLNAGAGLSNKLFIVSRGGDVLVYSGDVPVAGNSYNFKIDSVWYMGAMPDSRSVFTNFGGDVLLLSQVGLVALSKLVSGAPIFAPETYETAKIAPLINLQMDATRNLPGWTVRVHTRDSLVVITAPTTTEIPYRQYVYSLFSRGWCVFAGRKTKGGGAVWHGDFFWPDTSGNLWQDYGGLDEVTLDDTGGQPIAWKLFTSFQDLGSPGVWKQISLVRPNMTSDQPVSFAIEARWDYDLDYDLASPPYTPLTNAQWNAALWDNPGALWTGRTVVDKTYRGVNGMGTTVAFLMSGVSTSHTDYMGMDFSAVMGGVL